MNWYKTARLADSESDPDKSIYTTCQYCKRWAVEGSPRVWRKAKDLDEEENAQREIAEESMKIYPSPIGVSHGNCPYCSEVLEVMGYPKDKAAIDNIIKMSLMMS